VIGTDTGLSRTVLAAEMSFLYSIGYEKALPREVIAALEDAGVAVLLDVCDRPISRRPGLSRRHLAAAVEEAGMRDVHLAALGAVARLVMPPPLEAVGTRMFGRDQAE
jgi:hypothetical protein